MVGLAAAMLAMQTAPAHKPVPFAERQRKTASLTSRKIVPNPKWITTKWVEAEDAPFVSIAKSAEPVFASGWPAKSSADWKSKAKTAYQEWLADSQNNVKIFRASLYLGVLAAVDPAYSRGTDYGAMYRTLNRGWEFLDSPPKSFEFVRRGYAFNARDEDEHDYGDISKKLLERNPDDRIAVIGAIQEYHDKRRGPFADWMFATAEKYRAKSSKWRPWDDRLLGRAYQLKSWETHSKKDLLRAIELGQSAIDRTPAGLDAGFIKSWVRFMREKELPKLTD